MKPEDQAARGWVQKADHDYRTAVASLEQSPPITDTAAFHIQQAIEKLLKAYLVSRGADIERVHDLEVLCGDCATRDPSFEAWRRRVAPLSAYAVRFRYPGVADPPVERVREALIVMEEIRQFVMARLPRGAGNLDE